MSAGSASAAISPAARFGFHGVPFNVMRSSKCQRSNSGHLPTFLVLYTPLVVMVSILSLRSLMPMNASFACFAPPSRIGMKYIRSPNSTSCGTTYQHAIHTLCARHDQLDTSASISPRVPRETPSWDVYFAFLALSQRTHHHLFLHFTHRSATTRVPEFLCVSGWRRKCFCRNGFLVSDFFRYLHVIWNNGLVFILGVLRMIYLPGKIHKCSYGIKLTTSSFFPPNCHCRRNRHLFLRATRSIRSCICETWHFVQTRNPGWLGDLCGILSTLTPMLCEQVQLSMKFMQPCNPSSITIGNTRNPASCTRESVAVLHDLGSSTCIGQSSPNDFDAADTAAPLSRVNVALRQLFHCQSSQ